MDSRGDLWPGLGCMQCHPIHLCPVAEIVTEPLEGVEEASVAREGMFIWVKSLPTINEYCFGFSLLFLTLALKIGRGWKFLGGKHTWNPNRHLDRGYMEGKKWPYCKRFVHGAFADTLTFYVVPCKQMLRGLGLGKLITKGVYNGSIQKFNLPCLNEADNFQQQTVEENAHSRSSRNTVKAGV